MRRQSLNRSDGFSALRKHRFIKRWNTNMYNFVETFFRAYIKVQRIKRGDRATKEEIERAQDAVEKEERWS